MTQSVSVIALLRVTALLMNIFSYCSAENMYCVTPTTTLCSSCPHDSTNCATLSEYAQQAEVYFTSNTTMVFLPGEHVLDRNITVANVVTLTMCGGSSSDNIATVVRNGSVGFSFTNMVDFRIYSLAFTSYNRSWSYGSHPASNSALLLQSTQNAKLVNCSFHDNLGTALVVNDTNISLAGGSKFIRNQCTCQSFSDLEVHELGCGIAALNSTLTFTGNSFFHDNTQTASSYTLSCAGAIWASASLLHFNGTNKFTGNSANNNNSGGGAIYVVANTILSFIGASNFSYNSADRSGGAIEARDNVKITFNGTNNFINNSASNNGGAIHAQSNITLSFIGTSNFSQNLAGRYGGAINAYNNTVLTFHGTTCFINNSANNNGGGAIRAGVSTSLSFIGTSNFSQNSAYSFGGAIETFNNILLTFNGINTFTNNSASNNGGGAIYAGSNISLSLNEISYFSHNSAGSNGGAIEAYGNVLVTLDGNNNFTCNSANSSGGVIYVGSNASLIFNGTSSLINNSAVQGGGIFADESTIIFNKNIGFANNGHNTGDSRGGALYLYISSTLSILPNTTVCWENNHASLGGAIYVFDVNPRIYCTQITTYIPKQKCFFQLPGQNYYSGLNVQLVFKNNSADAAGSVLYGGAIDNCRLTGLDSHGSGEVFDMLVHIEDDTDYSTTSNISSDPFRMCPCDDNNHPDCSKSSEVLSVHRGESYQVSVVAVGQREGIVPANVTSVDECNLLCSQTIQKTYKTCTTLNYTVFSHHSVTLELYADGPCSTFGDKLVLELNGTQSCPASLENSSMCICDQAHKKYGIEHCTITKSESAQITRHSNETFWVGYNHSGLIFHPRCPFDYCVNHIVHFTLNNTDMQCAPNRSGLLCGACNEGYSLGLGTFQCMECTNDDNLALLVPFAVMGVALVFLLLVCKLTVATGTLSGLVFYANIVGDNRTIFLPGESTNPFTVFIAWLNLDFGIETCLYDGMNAYSKTWLQFVFPVYLWVLVGLMILISHFSQRFANLLGSNPVSILATLILLSYAKILRTIITALSSTDLEYSDHPSKSVRVWLYDANIDYVHGKHIPLFLVATIVFFFLFLPYTLLLLFGQWLQAISHLRLFSWVNSARLKPFMDSYHAPYKAKHRYWPGLLLVLRFVLLLVFALNFQREPSINMLAILVGTGILTVWAWVSGGVYMNWCLDALEASFTLNLIMLGVATYHVKLTGGNQLAVGYTSVSVAAITFIGILAYHIFQQLRHTKLWKKASKLNFEFKKLNKKLNTEQEEYYQNFAEDTTELGRFDRLRESLLDDLPQPTVLSVIVAKNNCYLAVFGVSFCTQSTLEVPL